MQKIENIELVNLNIDDYQELKKAMIESYITMPNSYWKEHQIKLLIDKFQEGQVAIKVNNHIAGVALSIIVNHLLGLKRIVGNEREFIFVNLNHFSVFIRNKVDKFRRIDHFCI